MNAFDRVVAEAQECDFSAPDVDGPQPSAPAAMVPCAECHEAPCHARMCSTTTSAADRYREVWFLDS